MTSSAKLYEPRPMDLRPLKLTEQHCTKRVITERWCM